MMPLDFHRATSVADAVATVAARANAVYLGGGTNLVDHMKLGIVAPAVVVDVTHLPLGDVESLPDGGVRIGAEVRNSDLAAHPLVRSTYPMLARALLSAASGQLRNLATTAGNLLQRTRCVYFQDLTTPCNKRVPGTGCSAIGGYLRYHAILGASEHCVAVHPSDMAVAMAALDAQVVYVDSSGEHRLALAQFYRLPGDRPDRDTTLPAGALITAVEIPRPPAGARSTYLKVRDRASYAFALTSVAAEVVVVGGVVQSARIALGGVAHQPWRATRVEGALTGEPAAEEIFRRAADAELRYAMPLAGNAFKVDLTRRAIVATLTSVTRGHQ
ncbi:MAG: xanthine dehydrogenase family protein subunit M [Actinomycetota bacterium]|uniref:Xanthine dehydrogenase family protein subunit M n=1 Tax=Mycobacterium lentiflavum TaxID=141349 RepID=A0ABY3UL22_MYCLN|nr:xanthine dehydrogenase family protein subunit M [Mycobacterium lentiflavum]MEE3064375.1 xanthine dehydrogenase family protein subunit M [Actinomycetota bacterium]ULP40310.1 xanthine dehydrogenase family protein subunit M [Mycobacterium lentiflavum]